MLSPFLHAEHLISVFLTELRVDALVDAHGVHGKSNCQQPVHLLVLFIDLNTRMTSQSRPDDITIMHNIETNETVT